MRSKLRLRKRMLSIAVLVGLVALSLGLTSAFAGGGRLHLYLVNSGTPTTFYPLSPTTTDPNCFAASPKPASLSTSPGTSLQQDNPNGSSSPSLLNMIHTSRRRLRRAAGGLVAASSSRSFKASE